MAAGRPLAAAFVTISPDSSGFRREAEAGVQAETAGLDATIPVKIDSKRAESEVHALRGRIYALTRQALTFKADLNDTAMQAKLATILAKLKAMPKNVTSEIDLRGYAKAMTEVAALEGQLRALGGTTARTRVSTNSMGQSFRNLGGHAGFAGKAIMMIATVAIGAGPGIVALAGAAVGLAAGLAGMATAGAAAAGVFAAMAGVTVAGFLKQRQAITQAEASLAKMTKGTDSYRAAQERLSASQANFRQQFGPMVPAFDALRAAWQKFSAAARPQTLDILARGMRTLAAALPALRPLFEVGAQAARQFMTVLDNWVRSGGLASVTSQLARMAAQNWAPFLQGLRNIATTLSATRPAMEQFTSWFTQGFASVTQSMANWARGEGQRTFREFFNWVRQTGPSVMKDIREIAQAAITLYQGFAPLSTPIHAVAMALARLVAAAPPGLITAITTALAGFLIASKISGAVALIAGALAKVAVSAGAAAAATGTAAVTTAAEGAAAAAAAPAVGGFAAAMNAAKAASFGWGLALTVVAATVGLMAYGLMQKTVTATDMWVAATRRATQATGWNLAGYVKFNNALAEHRAQLAGVTMETIQAQGAGAMTARMYQANRVALKQTNEAYRESQLEMRRLNTYLTGLQQRYGLTYDQAMRLAGAAGVSGDAIAAGGDKAQKAAAKVADLQAQYGRMGLVLNTVMGGTVSVQQSQDNLAASNFSLRSALDASSGSLSRSTEAGLASRQAFTGLVTSMMEYAKTAAQAGASQQQITNTLRPYVAQLFQAAGSNRSLRQEVLQLASAYAAGATDRQTAITALANMARQAGWSKGQIKALVDQLRAIPAPQVQTSLQQITAALQRQQQAAGVARQSLSDYVTTVRATGTASAQTQAARVQLINDMVRTGVNADVARRDVDAYAAAVRAHGAASNEARAARQQMNNDILEAATRARGARGDLATFTEAVRNHGTASAAARSARQTLIDDLVRSGMDARTARQRVDELTTSITKLPSKLVSITLNAAGGGKVTVTSSVKNASGYLQFHAAGGLIRGAGGPRSDSNLIAASAGEYVQQYSAVAHYGVPAMEAVNRRQAVIAYAGGGLVPGSAASRLQFSLLEAQMGAMPPAAGAKGTTFGTTLGNTFAQTLLQALKDAVAAMAAAAAGAAGPLPAAAGSLVAYAKKLLAAYGWGGQFAALNNIIMRESGWRVNATNPSSGAYGIPQALPASKMASAGSDWRTSGYTQLRWMMGYIKSRYGSPNAAWAFWQAHNWYAKGGLVRPLSFDAGGMLPPHSATLAINGTSKAEPVGGADLGVKLDQANRLIAALPAQIAMAVADSLNRVGGSQIHRSVWSVR